MVSVGNGDIAEYASVLLLGLMIFLNFSSIICFIYAFLGIKFEHIHLSNLATLIILFSICLTLYFLLVNRGKSRSLINQYESEDESKKMTGKIIILSYIFLSLTVFFLSLILMGKRNSGNL
jgi:uncharacterized membrane protein